MAELLLVANPARRKHKRRRKLSALQRKYFGKGHKGHKHRRRRAATAMPKSHHHRRRIAGSREKINPHRRRRYANPHRRHYRRHSNPLSVRGFTGSILPTVREGATGAVGALGLDALWGFVAGNATVGPYVSNPYVGFAAKAVGAVAVGALGGKLLRGKGKDLAVGAMTVTVHDFLKSLLQGFAPTIFGPGGSVPLGSYLSGSAPLVGTATVPAAYLPYSGVGSYLSGDSSGTVNTGVYTDDQSGMAPWGGSDEDGRMGYSGY